MSLESVIDSCSSLSRPISVINAPICRLSAAISALLCVFVFAAVLVNPVVVSPLADLPWVDLSVVLDRECAAMPMGFHAL